MAQTRWLALELESQRHKNLRVRITNHSLRKSYGRAFVVSTANNAQTPELPAMDYLFRNHIEIIHIEKLGRIAYWVRFGRCNCEDGQSCTCIRPVIRGAAL